jgi:hypothetical protein
MKLIIAISVALLLLISRLIIKKKANQVNDKVVKPDHLYSLNDHNQTDLLLSAEATHEKLNSIKEKYQWDEFDEYDNRMWEYMYLLHDKVIKNHDFESPDEFWNKSTRQQKVFTAFLMFTGDTDNGGVYQFIFNKPEYILAVGEMWQELGLTDLASDYQAVMNELSGKTLGISQLKNIFNDESKDFDTRWNAFAAGYKELKSVEKIEDYYYDNEFKLKLYKKVADYIEDHMAYFTS